MSIDKNSEMWKVASREVHGVIPPELREDQFIEVKDVRELMTLAFLRGIGWYEEQVEAARARKGAPTR